MRALSMGAILAAFLATLSWAQPGQPRLTPAEECSALRRLTSLEISVSTASLVKATDNEAEHCLVTGRILPQVRFRVYLPSQWNGRFYMHGNGGYAGNFPRIPGYTRKRLQQGYALAVTDTGHDAGDEPLASFARDPQKVLDFAFRAVHVTAEVAKRIVRIYYGRPHEKAYFEGCSTGGRQGLILAQRFPTDFDGIIVGAPILDETGQRISQVWIAKALSGVPFPRTKLAALAQEVYGRCDGKDGLKDGLIDDPRRCDFSPARDLPPCEQESEGSDCFTPNQIEALEKIYSDVRGGEVRIYPGIPPGGEKQTQSGRSGWDDWILSEDGPTTAVRFATSFFRFMAFPEPVEDFELDDFDFERDPKRTDWIASVLNATDTDLTSYEERGGKLLMFFGWADLAVNPLSGVEYYEKVEEQMGESTSDFFRLFMVPGMFHCVGGVGPSLFDKLEPLRNWVEQGVAPESLVASQSGLPDPAEKTRLLCPYPQVARYGGSGSLADAENFQCVEPSSPESKSP